MNHKLSLNRLDNTKMSKLTNRAIPYRQPDYVK